LGIEIPSLALGITPSNSRKFTVKCKLREFDGLQRKDIKSRI
jgi:hypothetical protein